MVENLYLILCAALNLSYKIWVVFYNKVEKFSHSIFFEVFFLPFDCTGIWLAYSLFKNCIQIFLSYSFLDNGQYALFSQNFT